jgi:hypothetical protein
MLTANFLTTRPAIYKKKGETNEEGYSYFDPYLD